MKTDNINVVGLEPLVSPDVLKERYPVSERVLREINGYRKSIYNIVKQHEDRFMVITGPCSIHDPDAAFEYAGKLLELQKSLGDRVLLVMRVYFEKPRTTIGWKGLINDPDLNGSQNIQKGLTLAREILLQIAEMGLPIATEFLDPISPQYYSDLVSWVAIGARTTESQTHREMASGVSAPVGYKNGTSGNIDVALNAMESACHPHKFIGIDGEGRACLVETSGNGGGHLVLRGGNLGPNFDADSVAKAEEELIKAGANQAIVIDCSHANSYKDHTRQPEVAMDVLSQKKSGNQSIVGIMLESHLNDGKQAIPKDLKTLKYGVSVTDACINWDTTRKLIQNIDSQLPVN